MSPSSAVGQAALLRCVLVPAPSKGMDMYAHCFSNVLEFALVSLVGSREVFQSLGLRLYCYTTQQSILDKRRHRSLIAMK